MLSERAFAHALAPHATTMRILESVEFMGPAAFEGLCTLTRLTCLEVSAIEVVPHNSGLSLGPQLSRLTGLKDLAIESGQQCGLVCPQEVSALPAVSASVAGAPRGPDAVLCVGAGSAHGEACIHQQQGCTSHAKQSCRTCVDLCSCGCRRFFFHMSFLGHPATSRSDRVCMIADQQPAGADTALPGWLPELPKCALQPPLSLGAPAGKRAADHLGPLQPDWTQKTHVALLGERCGGHVAALSSLSNLWSLKLADDVRIADAPDGLCVLLASLTELRDVECDGISLLPDAESFCASLTGLVQLTRLVVSQTPLQAFLCSSAWGGLRILDLSYNELSGIPQNLNALGALVELDLSQQQQDTEAGLQLTDAVDRREMFSCMPALQKISLSQANAAQDRQWSASSICQLTAALEAARQFAGRKIDILY